MYDNDTVYKCLLWHHVKEDLLWVAKKITGDICKEILPPLYLQKLQYQQDEFSRKGKIPFSRDKYHQPFFFVVPEMF